MMAEKKIHLICNAHIDPIWQWGWDEGISAAIATFKSAADLSETHDFIFCHGESLLYEAIEEHAPELFERIKKLVKEGRWHITGGWYLQPDCLMPCGETFVRHHKVGSRYFKEKFGIDVKIATSYDAFGHSVGLAQILKKTGYEGYIVCRPWATQFDYPSRFFNWTGPDGSSIKTTQTFSYSSSLGKATKKILDTYEQNKTDNVILAPWGVGNHGGGPSRIDLAEIAELKIEGAELFHSTPENLFADALFDSVIEQSLVTSNPGCYSSMAKIKQAYRKCENIFYSTEKMMASLLVSGVKINTDDFDSAEKKMLLASFHDILPGSCVEDGEREGIGLLSSCDKTMRDYRTSCFLKLVIGQEVAKDGEYPIFVYNYMPYTVNTPVEVEFTLADQNRNLELYYLPHVYNSEGEEILCQQIKENSTINIDWRKKIVFNAELNPLGITRFNVKVTSEQAVNKLAESIDEIDFSKYTSLISVPIALEMYEDTADPWAMSEDEQLAVGTDSKDFRIMTKQEAQSFCKVKHPLSPTRITESGTVMTEIEQLVTCDNTDASIKYKFYKDANILAYGIHSKENDIHNNIRKYLEDTNPNILVITGHDAYYKKKGNKNSSDAYRNSNNFIKAIKEARKYEKAHDKLIIIAGACQSNYEELIRAGANFASSPKRINIHALDPAIIASTIGLSDKSEDIDLIGILSKTKYGPDGVGGIKTKGTMYVGYPR